MVSVERIFFQREGVAGCKLLQVQMQFEISHRSCLTESGFYLRVGQNAAARYADRESAIFLAGIWVVPRKISSLA